MRIVEATCADAKARKLKRLALFGTRYTMQASFDPKVFSREGTELLVPESNDQDYIHDKYMNELVPGKFLPETRTGLLAIIDRVKTKNGSAIRTRQSAMGNWAVKGSNLRPTGCKPAALPLS
jgi:aspartate/glutamate racemase